MKEKATGGLYKMSELAAATGVSATTIKYYVREGLVDIAYKTGRNMAYYHPSCVERVKLIKMLQSERYYPLSLIKQLLQSGGTDIRELELMDMIHKSDRVSSSQLMPLAEALKSSGLSRDEAAELEAAGLISPVTEGRRRLYCEQDVSVMRLAYRRSCAGIPLAQTITAFGAYTQALSHAVGLDVESLAKLCLMPYQWDTQQIVRIIRTSDETLDEFITLKRYEANRRVGSSMIDKIQRLIDDFKSYLLRLADLCDAYGYAEQSERLRTALAGRATEEGVWRICADVAAASRQGLAMTLAACHRANEYFRSVTPECSAGDAQAASAVRQVWIYITPEEFGWPTPQAENAAFLAGAEDGSFAQDVLELLDR